MVCFFHAPHYTDFQITFGCNLMTDLFKKGCHGLQKMNEVIISDFGTNFKPHSNSPMMNPDEVKHCTATPLI